jgi:hypothetical protein
MAAVEVILTDESYVILGRDILNQFHIALDGLHRRLENNFHNGTPLELTANTTQLSAVWPRIGKKSLRG